jgi:hypothetical protein
MNTKSTLTEQRRRALPVNLNPNQYNNMKRTIKLLLVLVASLAASLHSHAQFYTIAPGGPTPGYLPDTIYTPGGPPPLVGPGALPAFPGPPPPYLPAAYIIDGLSSGLDAGNQYMYSVTFGSLGLPASPVAFEVAVGTGPSHIFGPGPVLGPLPAEAEGDVFTVVGPGFGAVVTPTAFAPVPTDEFFLGLNVGGGPAGDNLNSLTYRMPAVPGGFYYSLAAGGLGASPLLPADIALAGVAGPWAPAPALGLDLVGGPGSDDIDALLVRDLGILGIYEPGIDFVAFSLTPGSATLGALGYVPGTGGADLFVPAGALPALFMPAVAFGLLPTDNLDAIDVVPEPSSALLLLGTTLPLLLRRRRATV